MPFRVGDEACTVLYSWTISITYSFLDGDPGFSHTNIQGDGYRVPEHFVFSTISVTPGRRPKAGLVGKIRAKQLGDCTKEINSGS